MALDIYTNYKNFVYFIIIKILNRRQVRWVKIFEKYKFIIYYILEKNNGRINALSRRLNLIKKKQKTYSLLKLHFDNRIIKKICQLNTIFIIK